MRCQEMVGFLMKRRCENISERQCAQCTKAICVLHETPLTAGAAPGAEGATSAGGYVCPECAQKQGVAPGAPGARAAGPYDDPYYQYPYYGGYHPYWYGALHGGSGYNAADRAAFDRSGAGASGLDDATGS